MLFVSKQAPFYLSCSKRKCYKNFSPQKKLPKKSCKELQKVKVKHLQSNPDLFFRALGCRVVKRPFRAEVGQSPFISFTPSSSGVVLELGLRHKGRVKTHKKSGWKVEGGQFDSVDPKKTKDLQRIWQPFCAHQGSFGSFDQISFLNFLENATFTLNYAPPQTHSPGNCSTQHAEAKSNDLRQLKQPHQNIGMTLHSALFLSKTYKNRQKVSENMSIYLENDMYVWQYPISWMISNLTQ